MISMKRSKWITAGGAVLVIGALASWSLLQGHAKDGFQTVSVTRGDIQSSIAATGTCNAVVTVQVGSLVSGNIKELYADFNTKVKKGQLVALIDPEMFRARVSQAKANLDNARAAVVNAQAAATKGQADIAVARAALENVRADLAKAEVNAEDAKIRNERRLTLFQQGILSKEDRDTAQVASDSGQAAVESARAQVQSAQSSIQAAEAQHQVALAQVESSKAQVRQFEAALQQAELDLAHTEIRAPVDGTVIARRMDIGQTVAASFQAPTIFEIAQDLTKMQVDTNVDEADIGHVQVGQRAWFTVDAYAGVTFPARVEQIRVAPINTQNVITYDVVITADNRDLTLFPGMTANVRILTGSAKNTLVVPNAALRYKPAVEPLAPARESRAGGRQRPDKQTVYVLAADGQPRRVPVTTGLSDGSFTQIAGGELHEGELLIIGQNGTGGTPDRAAASRRRGPMF
jgi:HlyD family secretion protein